MKYTNNSSWIEQNYLMTFINWVIQSFITRNIGQIATLAAIDKSVSPNSLEAKCMCPI